jgi:hypothetical protein
MSPITTATYRFLHDEPAAPKPAEAPKPATAPSTERTRMAGLKNVFANLRALASPIEPTPAPDALAPKPTPPGCVSLGGNLYRLPRGTGDPVAAAHDLRLMAELFGTPAEMRALRVPEDVIATHIPKAPIPAAPKAPAPLPALARTIWPRESTALAAGIRPTASSRVCQWNEVLAECQPAVVERVADHYDHVGAKVGDPNAYAFVHALRQGLSPRAPGHWSRYIARPQKLEQLGFKDVVWSWHRLADHR